MTTTTTDQVAVDLLAAAEVLRTRGWTRGTYESHTGRCCTFGAVRIVIADDDTAGVADRQRRRTAARDAIEGLLDTGIEEWNDERCESADEAAELLERIAAERAAEAS